MNVIWTVIRSIIYKIPLKLLLVLLAVFGILFACFSSALTLDNLNYPWEFEFQIAEDFYWNRNIKQYYNYTHNWISCLFVSNNYCTLNDWTTTYSLQKNIAYCTDSNTIILDCSSTAEYYYYVFLWDNWLKEWYPDYTSLQCQTEYNLIPVSSVDSEYCESNNLCSSSDCPGGDLTPWVSNIFINDVFHPWAFNIIMNIPEEIDRDYTYTNSWTNFNLDIVGYNQDEEYIQSVIDVQNYKPTSEDFTRVFSNISNFWALLIACLFVILVFYMLKKAFK